MTLIALGLYSTKVVLYRATNASLGGELFANGSICSKRTSDLLCCATQSSALYFVSQ